VAHGCMVRVTSPKPLLRNRSSFYLLTTPMSQASRFVCKCVFNIRKSARKPTRLIEFAEVTKEWSKESRDVKKILDEGKKGFKKKMNRKLSKTLIAQIYNRNKNKSKKHNDDSNDQMIIDEDNNYDDVLKRESLSGPDYLKYFEQKPDKPCYIPENLLYPKPTLEFIAKFHQSLLSQTRKRTHEQSNDSHSNYGSDTSPSSKRTLLTKPVAIKTNTSKTSSKSTKPTQAINLKNTPDNMFYSVTRKIKNIRKDLASNDLRKLARSPTKLLKHQQNSYAVLAKLANPNQQPIAKTNGETNGEVVVLD
jgi:hypothetical protein